MAWGYIKNATIQSHVIIQGASNAWIRKNLIIFIGRSYLCPFPTDCFTIKTTVGKEYKEPKGRNGGAMLKLEYDKKEIEGVIDKIVKKTMNMDLTWDWPCGVAYYGISDAYEKTGKKEYLDLLKDRIDELIDLGLPKVWTVNACAMGHCLITLYQATGEQQYHDILMSKIAYLRKDALRFGRSCIAAHRICQQRFPGAVLV